jgi:multiple sugar transport system permease protein
MPFLVMFVNASRENYDIQQGISLIPGNMLRENMQTLRDRQNFNVARGMWNSFQVAGLSTVLALYFSTLTAYGLVVYSFRLRKAAFTLIMATMMIPTQVSIVGFFTFMFRMGLTNTYWPLTIPAIASPTVVFFMRQYMLTALPLEMVEAARIDGSSEFNTFNRIALPLMKPALATQAIFIFIGSWNRLFEPTMLISSQDKYTMPMLVALLRSDRFRTDYGTVYLALSLTVLPLIVVYLLLSKHIIRGVALGGVKE